MDTHRLPETGRRAGPARDEYPVRIPNYSTGPDPQWFDHYDDTIVGYDDTSWIVNDPAGDWEVCYQCGPGDHIRYAFGGGWDQNLSYDGDIWYSVSDLRPL